MDQKNLLSFRIEDERRCRDMAGKGAAGMDVISLCDLPAQESMPFLRQIERSRVLIQKSFDVLPEGGRFEAQE